MVQLAHSKAGINNHSDDATAQLLLSKLTPPQVPENLLARPRLQNPCQCNSVPQLVLIEAPAGYGKTCIVRQWLEAGELVHCWLCLEASDDNPRLFWDYLITACRKMLPALGAITAPQEINQAFIITLLNQLTLASERAGPSEMVLIIDNYQQLTDTGILQSIDFFINHLPPHLKLIISSRNTIALSHRCQLLASGQLLQYDTAQLSFTEEESRALLEQRPGKNTNENIAQLSQALKGWPMGLKLASMETPTSRNSASSSQLINSYLVEEALLCLPQPLLDMVKKTVCLSRLSVELVDGLVEQFDGQVCLDRLRAGVAFLQATENGQQFRYHALYANAAREYLNHNEAKSYRKHCMAAARRLEEQGFFSDAIELLASIEQWHKATDLIIDASISRIRAGDHETIYNWILLLPDHWIERCPRVLYLSVLCGGGSGQIELKQQYARLDQAEKLLVDAIDAEQQSAVELPGNFSLASGEQALELLEELHNLRSELSRQHGHSEHYENISWDTVRRAANSRLVLGSATDLGRGMELYLSGKTQAAGGALEDAIRHARQENYQLVMIIAANYLSSALLMMGRPIDGLRRFENTLNWVRARDIQLFPPAYLNNGGCVPIHCEMNKLEQAEKNLAPYIEFANTANVEPAQQYTIHIFHYRVMRSKGDYSAAALALANAEAVALDEFDNWNWCATPLDAYRAHLALLQGDSVTAAQWAQKREQELSQSSAFRTEEERLILARVWIQQQRYEDTIRLLTTLRHAAALGNRLLHIVQSHVLEALCREASGQASLADAALHTAATLAEPCHFRRVFLEERQRIVPLLQRAMENGVTPHYTRELLKACAQDDRAAIFTGKGVLIEPLSTREVEILQLVGDGLRNKDIADTLSISISTVKAHLYNIFSKLQSRSRTEAVSQGRALGII